jgi:hypothetical protein
MEMQHRGRIEDEDLRGSYTHEHWRGTPQILGIVEG